MINKNLVIIIASEYYETNGKKYFRSGIERQIDDLSKKFSKTYIYAPKSDKKIDGFQYNKNVAVRSFSGKLHSSLFEYIKRYKEYDKRINQIIDIHKDNSIFLAYFPDSYFGIQAVRVLNKRKKEGIKYFVRVTANLTREFKERNNKIYRKILYYFINPIIFVYFKQILKDVLCFYSGYKIYNQKKPSYKVFSASMFKNEIYKRSTKIRKKKNILYVGRFDKKKGLPYLIRAMKLVQAECNLTIIGFADKEYQMNEINSLIKLNNLKEKVKIKGFIPFGPKLFKEYKKADILVFPSLEDQQGKSYMEAMFFGVAVISSNIPGVSSIITNRKNGILVKPASPEEIASSIDLLCKNDKIRNSLIQEGYKLTKNMSIEKMNSFIIKKVKSHLNIN